MIEVLEFKPGHLDFMVTKPIYDNDYNLKERTEMFASCENSYVHTVLFNKLPACILGGTEIWPGVYEAWGLTSDHVFLKPITFMRAIIRLLDFYQEKLGIFRYQMTINSKLENGKKFAEKLGFEYEGTMKKFGYDQTDYYLYARIY